MISRSQNRTILERLAREIMIDRGLLPEFSPAAVVQLDGIESPPAAQGQQVSDLREMLWCSIDNDDSRDLDQLTVAEQLPDGSVKIRVAVSDVDCTVTLGTPIDSDARHNTTSVYTAALIFPMLPEKLSTDLTSLNPGEDRLAVVVEMEVGEEGKVLDSAVYRALVHNHSKLAYNAVASWLEGEGEAPEALSTAAGLEENLRLQDRVAQRMKQYRHFRGALSLETIEARPVFSDGELCELDVETRNRAKEIIEDFMIAANGVTARFLADAGFPSVRRVVRTPKRWDRIVELAAGRGYNLPGDPDSKALEGFLMQERAADPLRFPDLSLSVVKLLGSGEYTAEFPGQTAQGHFGLAVKDYSHSTAPNRRYTDLITQRLLKAALAGSECPYSDDDLSELAWHCTKQEDEAKKVERRVLKSAAALLLQSRIGEHFDAIVTGASAKGTWARLLDVPVEGKVVSGYDGADVGDRIRLQLIEVDVERGYIDFRCLGFSHRG